ncbi:hypothetical protein ACSFBM_20180 [Variovorax sp. GB1R11]|uniref:hypothetical protein n=1 Tax=Variovorax sp. GB1R11 TaxID=3443741 RepID=UPI003F45667A
MKTLLLNKENVGGLISMREVIGTVEEVWALCRLRNSSMGGPPPDAAEYAPRADFLAHMAHISADA